MSDAERPWLEADRDPGGAGDASGEGIGSARDAAVRPTVPAPEAGRMETEAEAIARLRAAGFTIDLRLADDGRLLGDGDESWTTSELTIVELVRFEGMSDPSDEAMVLAIEAPDGKRGTLALPYGPDMTTAQVDVSRALLLRRDR